MQGSMTPSLLCCQSANIDACGVCDGDGSACQKAGVVSITYNQSPSARKLSQSSAIVADAKISSIVQQTDTAQLESIHAVPASHARDVLAVGSEYDDVVAEFKLCVCTSRKLPLAFKMPDFVLLW